jgi:hypothetical protein
MQEESFGMNKPMINRRGFMGLLGGLNLISASWQPLHAYGNPRLAAASADRAQDASREPFAIHPDNPKYFLFRGKPRVLIAPTEHYGSVINRRFDYARYLTEAADKKQTVTRTFLLFRELQGARNPYSPAKPESPDFVTPYVRSGPGSARDGEPKYDLDRWNAEYFDRLHGFLSLASELGIVAELTVFSNTYADSVWELNPLHAANNLQALGKGDWQEYNTLRDQALVNRQIAYARKIVQETSSYDNIYYEICNEPGGGLEHHATLEEVNAWQTKIAGVIREELRKLNRKRLIAGQQAFAYAPHFYQAFDDSFSGPLLDAVNIHPLPNLIYKGRTYQLGNFMSKELQLAEFRDFFLATYPAHKPTISDEDNCASCYRDHTGWTIHRKRAWMAVMCGAHYDYIDFSLQAGAEAGTDESRRSIRTWMKNLSEFIHSFDFIKAKPLPEWIESSPPALLSASLAAVGKDYVAYLADAREVTDPNAGRPIAGPISFTVPPGAYVASFYSPHSGCYSPGADVSGGQRVTLEMEPFEDDIVLRVTRKST